MNDKIDVLAVLDRAAKDAAGERDMHDDNDNKSAADGWESLRAELRQARAAIAGLIEADKEYDEAYAAAVANPAKEAWLADAEERRAAALARVGGA